VEKEGCRASSLELGKDDLPHISYGKTIEDRDLLHYARWTGSAWEIERVNNDRSIAPHISFVLDEDGFPHIGYSIPRYLAYTYRTDAGWKVESAAPDQGGYRSHISLAVDEEGAPHICNVTEESLLKCVHRIDGDWISETLDDVGGIDGAVSLALDEHGRYHVSYFDEDDLAIKYALWKDNAWDIQDVERGEGFAGWNTSLVLDEDDHPHISYYGRIGDSFFLKYARWTGSVWDIQVVDTSGDSGVFGNTSLALDGDGHPHIAYTTRTYDDLSGGLRYAHWTGSEWDIQVVDSGVKSVSLALDEHGYPHIVYSKEDNNKYLYTIYTYWTGSEWGVQILHEIHDPFSISLSLALDGNGYPHLGYIRRDEDGSNLRHAYWTGNKWDAQIVDGNADAVSLALDGDGHPHVCYRVSSGRPPYSENLKYARWTGSVWDIQTVVAGLDQSTNSYTSLALDEHDRPHISYSNHVANPSRTDLRYAHWTGSEWDIQVVDGAGDVGWHNSLALDASGRPHISYLDQDNWNLKYAHLSGTEEQ
jgi:hypothetical protein